MARLSDPRVAQYWDKNHLFAKQLARRLNSDSNHPRPRCCNDSGVDWDELVIYRQDARWDDQLPRAVFLDGPVVNSLRFADVVKELLSKATGPKQRSENSRQMRSIRYPFLTQTDSLLLLSPMATLCSAKSPHGESLLKKNSFGQHRAMTKQRQPDRGVATSIRDFQLVR